MLLQKLVIFVVCSIVFFSPTQCSQVAQTIISISFCNPESIAFAAISPNCSRYAITKKGATQLSVYETSTHTLLNTISTGTTKAETTGALHFIDNEILLYAALRCYSGFSAIKICKINQLQDAKNLFQAYNPHSVTPHPDNTNVIAYIGTSDYYVSFSPNSVPEHSISFNVSGYEHHPISSHGTEWNTTNNHLLFHACIHGKVDEKPKNDIFILDYDIPNSELSNKIDLWNNEEHIYTARWMNKDHIIGLSDVHIFIWNIQGKPVHAINKKKFSYLAPLSHKVVIAHPYPPKTEKRCFYPGKIAFSKDKQFCFIEQAMGGSIIVIDLNTFNPQLIKLKNLTIDQMDHNGHDREYTGLGMRIVFSPDAKSLIVLYKNKLSWYNPQTGDCYKSFPLSKKNKVLSIEYNNNLVVCHDKGFDIFNS